jgi:hypothetical protein
MYHVNLSFLKNYGWRKRELAVSFQKKKKKSRKNGLLIRGFKAKTIFGPTKKMCITLISCTVSGRLASRVSFEYFHKGLDLHLRIKSFHSFQVGR